jgi:Flp pilus assembly pilin Flp
VKYVLLTVLIELIVGASFQAVCSALKNVFTNAAPDFSP